MTPMPKLILHTGLHKTGTTSVQKMLHQNVGALAQQGFLYPKTGLADGVKNWGHHPLAYALRNLKTGRELWQALRAEVEDAQLPNVIVSSEELSLLPFHTFPALQPYRLIAELFKGYQIIVLCYLRPQEDMAASLYNHHVKSVGESRDILAFLTDVAPRLEYMQYLHVASAALGDAALDVRRYGPQWLKGDILDDLAHQIGLKLTVDIQRPKMELNPGLTDTGLAAMRKANLRFIDNPVKLKIERRRILAMNKARPFESANSLTPDLQAAIKALYNYKNVQIGRRFLRLDGNLFDPDVKPLPRPAEVV